MGPHQSVRREGENDGNVANEIERILKTQTWQVVALTGYARSLGPMAEGLCGGRGRSLQRRTVQLTTLIHTHTKTHTHSHTLRRISSNLHQALAGAGGGSGGGCGAPLGEQRLASELVRTVLSSWTRLLNRHLCGSCCGSLLICTHHQCIYNTHTH